MKAKIFLGAALLFSISAVAQSATDFYGLARKNAPDNEIFLAKVNPATGVVTNISSSSLSQIVNITGAALNPYDSSFYFMVRDSIKTISLISGVQTNVAKITNPLGDSYFDNFRFNNSDSSLYGLARRSFIDSGELYLAKINPLTGIITQISPSSIGTGYALAGNAIDPYQKVFYYSVGTNLIGVDMYTGTIYSNTTIKKLKDQNFDNFTYSCVDTTIYGLIRQNYFSYEPLLGDSTTLIEVLDSTSIHFGKIDPSTGVLTTISPVSLGDGGYSLNAGSTIDPNTMTYYYNNGRDLIGVSLKSGLKVSQQKLSNVNGQFFDLMRIASNCEEATQPRRLFKTTSTKSPLLDEIVSNVFPNPAKDNVIIESPNTLTKIQVCNILGTVVFENMTPSKKYTLDIANYASGLYFVKIYAQNKMISTKFIKE